MPWLPCSAPPRQRPGRCRPQGPCFRPAKERAGRRNATLGWLDSTPKMFSPSTRTRHQLSVQISCACTACRVHTQHVMHGACVTLHRPAVPPPGRAPSSSAGPRRPAPSCAAAAPACLRPGISAASPCACVGRGKFCRMRSCGEGIETLRDEVMNNAWSQRKAMHAA